MHGRDGVHQRRVHAGEAEDGGLRGGRWWGAARRGGVVGSPSALRSRVKRLPALAVALVLLVGVLLVGLVARAPVPPKRATPKSTSNLAERLPRDEALRREALPPELEPLRALAKPKVPPQEGDWLAEHPEDGQSVAQHHVDAKSVAGRTVYLVQVGRDATTEAVVKAMTPLLAAHFQLAVKELPPLAPEDVSQHEREGQLGRQWLTIDVLAAVERVRPADAAAVMAVTAVDLYPDPSWNFVFGQASYDERVGVMSLARTGDFSVEPRLVVKRSYQTGMHEIGHILRLLHCIAWECPMNGCNHQDESDSRPLEPCPHCLAKLQAVTGMDARRRLMEMRAAFAKAGLSDGVEEVDEELRALGP